MSFNIQLSPNQRKVLEIVTNFIAKNGVSPSIREIQKDSKIGSLRGVSLQLDVLEKLGYIAKVKGARGISINESGNSLLSTEKIAVPSFALANIDDQRVNIPVMSSSIPAGYADMVSDYSDNNIELTLSETRGMRNAFAVRVSGDSMVNAGINDGDLAIISPQSHANNNDIVAALVLGKGVTLKQFVSINGTPILMPANPKYKPIVDDFVIQGKLINIIKMNNINNNV